MKNHHDDSRAILNRLSRAIGHLEHVKTMVAEDKDCTEILVQIAAVKAAVNSIGNQILKDHILYCAIKKEGEDQQNTLNELANAIDRYVK